MPNVPVHGGDVEATKARAQERFQRGLTLARSQDWDGALAEFTASRQLYPTRSATRNAAVALQRLQRPVEACALYEALLDEFATTMPPDQVLLARKELAAALAQTARIAFEPGERGVLVMLDGAQRGVTPLAEPLRVDPGPHTVRLAKPGFESRELQLRLAVGTTQRVNTSLQRLTHVGVLSIREATNQVLEVLIDSAMVGTTPWSGSLAPGVHAVQLRGSGRLGTSPSQVTVKAGEPGSLVLRAVALEAWARLEPAPRHANLFVDGVPVGPGIWEGRLGSGTHRFDAVAPGYLPFTATLNLASGERKLIVTKLELDSADRRNPRQIPMYVEAGGGVVLARSFGGDADCDCSDRSRPFGFQATGRVGFTLLPALSLEAVGGYLRLTERVTRDVVIDGDEIVSTWRADDYHDTIRLSGPIISLGAAYHARERFPVRARAAVGLAFLRSESTNFGTFTATAQDADHGAQPIERPASIEEARHLLFTPFGSIELRAGYRVGKHLVFDLGVGLSAFFPPRQQRTRSDGASIRSGVVASGRWPNGEPLRLGEIALDQETLARPFLVLSPSLAARYAF
jgi:hypothetical protein